MSSTTDRLRAILGRRAGQDRRPLAVGRLTAAARRPEAPRRRTDRDRGQVLVIFAFGIVGILAVAALVFDVGQNLFERRKQQDAADASALAGARWLTTATCKAHPSATSCPEAVSAALALANTHGYPSSQVTVSIPAISGPFQGLPGYLQVSIDSSRGSYFAGVVGITSFRIGAQAVAENNLNYPFPYSMLSLDPTGCKAGWAHGNGVLTVQGDVMVDSTCNGPNGAMTVNGTGATMVGSGTCATAGSISASTGTLNCATVQTPAPVVADPLLGLAGPTIGSAAVPDPPGSMYVTGATASSNKAPNFCPGASGSISTKASPKGCTVNFNTEDKTVWLYPGVYYGGLSINQTSRALTVYMFPGIYYMAGGGFSITGQPTVKTVDAGTILTPYPTTLGGGVLVYNTDCTGCGAGGNSAIKPINFGNTQSVQLKGYTGSTYTGMLIWQDRNASAQPPMAVQGSTSMSLSGTIYLPLANFVFTGNGGAEVLNAQVICYDFEMGGNGNVSVTYDPNTAIKLSGIGLVQ